MFGKHTRRSNGIIIKQKMWSKTASFDRTKPLKRQLYVSRMNLVNFHGRKIYVQLRNIILGSSEKEKRDHLRTPFFADAKLEHLFALIAEYGRLGIGTELILKQFAWAVILEDISLRRKKESNEQQLFSLLFFNQKCWKRMFAFQREPSGWWWC